VPAVPEDPGGTLARRKTAVGPNSGSNERPNPMPSEGRSRPLYNRTEFRHIY